MAFPNIEAELNDYHKLKSNLIAEIRAFKLFLEKKAARNMLNQLVNDKDEPCWPNTSAQEIVNQFSEQKLRQTLAGNSQSIYLSQIIKTSLTTSFSYEDEAQAAIGQAHQKKILQLFESYQAHCKNIEQEILENDPKHLSILSTLLLLKVSAADIPYSEKLQQVKRHYEAKAANAALVQETCKNKKSDEVWRLKAEQKRAIIHSVFSGIGTLGLAALAVMLGMLAISVPSFLIGVLLIIGFAMAAIGTVSCFCSTVENITTACTQQEQNGLTEQYDNKASECAESQRQYQAIVDELPKDLDLPPEAPPMHTEVFTNAAQDPAKKSDEPESTLSQTETPLLPTN